MDPYGGPGASRPGALNRVGGSGRPGHNARDRGTGSVPTQNLWLGQAGQGKAQARTLAAAAARAPRGSLPRSGLGLLCKMGRTSAPRLTPKLLAPAPLPPLPPTPARSQLAQPRAAAAATPAAVIPAAHPHRSCCRSRSPAQPSRGSAAQRLSASRLSPILKGWGQRWPRPCPGHGQGAGTPQNPSSGPRAVRQQEPMGEWEKSGALRNVYSTPERAGQTGTRLRLGRGQWRGGGF